MDEDRRKGTAAGKPAEKVGPPPASSSPMAELKKSNEKLDKVLRRTVPTGRPRQSCSGKRSEARRILPRLWRARPPVAGPTLGNHHAEAARGLRDHAARAGRTQLPKQVHGNANYNIKYEKEIKDGNEANVTGVLNTVARGKKVKIALEYKMLWRGDHWVVYDVVTDEQSMVENYRDGVQQDHQQGWIRHAH